jgi:ATP-dependent helicase HrpA
MGDREETIRSLLNDAPRSVRGLYRARLRGVEKLRSKGKKTGPVLESIERDLVNAIESYERRKRSVPEISYPEDLPVSARRDEIKDAIQNHQVVIVCGETGSGKTTQLPKICLELGRGTDGMIAHTQPRRIAARSVAARVAEELGVELGSAVGYKIRFGDQTTDDTLVKVMTDGILLAETRSDRELRAYDTIIVDEAHERSLNIDFLLGSLRRLIERRPDLKLIITSATLDAGRFAEHFADGEKPAPVIEVQGRTYPVELRYRPEEVLSGMPVPEAASHAASELVLEGHDDVLVFMPGEREIRETAHELRKREYLPDNVDIVPLYARLSPQEQQRVFKPGHAPRIVIATNVAETSITVPRIRSVVDPGLARMNRYNPRTKLHGLMIEPISQASSAQRAGRCGRIAPGVCVRLFDRDDFDRRDEYTQPELLRSNLTSVILQMIDLKLGEPEDFPFVDRPDHRQWRDGFETLHELGAIDDAHALTDIGRKMARLPVDPRVARMILAAHDEGCLHDVLIIAAALSTQDPRVRPHDKQDAADQAHEIYRVEGSDFLSYLRIWDWYHQSHEKLTRRRLQRACEKQFLAPRRIDEWREVYRQLRGLCQEIKLEVKPRHTEDPDSVHRALLAGLLTNIGTKGERHVYKGTRNTAFMINPGSVVFEEKPQWVIAGEIVRTTKVYARTVARVNPKWIEDAAKHLISKTYSNPRYEEKTGRVVADERVTLYGLDLVPRRTVHYGPIDPKSSRELFIHHALVEGELKTRSAAMKRNKSLLAKLRNMEAKARRGDLIADTQAIFNFYDARLPEDVYSGKSFERYAAKHEGDLTMREEDLVLAQDAKVTHETHPDFVRVGARDAGLSYTFMPGDLLDGVTVRVRVEDLPHVTRETLEWSVPGFHRELVEFLIKSLPKSIRRQFDAPALAQELTPRLSQGEGSVGSQLAAMLSNKAGVTIRPEQFRSDQVPEHLSPRISVLDEHGKEIASGRDLKAMKDRFRDAVHKAVDEAAEGFNRDGLTDWDLDEFPEKVEFEDQGRKVSGFAAMVVDGAAVNLRVRTSKWVAERQTRAAQGLLIGLGVARELKLRPQQMPGYSPLSVAGAACGFSRDDIKAAMLARTGMALTIDEHGIIRDREEFDARLTRAWDNGNAVMLDTIAKLSGVVGSVSKAKGIVASEHPPAWSATIRDIRSQIEVLTQDDWLLDTPTRWLLCFPRYIRAMEVRLERLRNIGPERDSAMVRQVEPWVRCVRELRDQGAHTDDQVAEHFETLFWMVQEWRVATFAQELRTSVPVSDKRLRAQLDLIIHAG